MHLAGVVPLPVKGSVRRPIRPTTILGDDEVVAITRRLETLLPPAIRSASEHFGVRGEDIIRFGSLAHRCRERRERVGFSVKDVAGTLGIPQYRIKAVEHGRLKEIRPPVLLRYVELLGLQRWFARWRGVNRGLATRMGIDQAPASLKRTSRPATRQR